MNKFEALVAGALTAQGWRVLRNGWPDFLCWRERDGKQEIICVEVKNVSTGDKVNESQMLLHSLLETAGIPVRIITDPDIKQDLSDRTETKNTRAQLAETLLQHFEKLLCQRGLRPFNSGRSRTLPGLDYRHEPEYRNKRAEIVEARRRARGNFEPSAWRVQ